MMQLWIGTALLAGSWMLGLNYFAPAAPLAWLVVLVIGVGLFYRGLRAVAAATPCPAVAAASDGRWRETLLTIVLLLPATGFAPWPYRIIPLLLILGVALRWLPIPRVWPRRLGGSVIAVGVVLLVQAAVLQLYIAQTARSHELPWPLPDGLAMIAALLGMDANAHGSDIALYSMRQVQHLGATWELLVDPVTFCFYFGALATAAFAICGACPVGQRWKAWIHVLRALTLVLLVWLPLRAGLLMAVYLHRILRSAAEQPLHAMNHFFSPWMLLALLIVPVLLAWRFVRWTPVEEPADDAQLPQTAEESETPDAVPLPDVAEEKTHYVQRVLQATLPFPWAAVLLAAGVGVLTWAVAWQPSGARKEGRVLVVERHSTWEPTDKTYDTNWYGELSGYNYAAIYDYLAQYFQMSRLPENGKLDEQTLAGCDVLVIKTPTARYSPQEVKAVQQFVAQGGGLLLIGDHTNFSGMSTTMNDIVRPMGFTFRNDLLFSFADSPYDQHYTRAATPHPAVLHVPAMDFAVSCSIDPGCSNGRPIIESTGLWSMGADYHRENYHPIPEHCAEMRYGAFIQAWETQYGKGRVAAFTDSTIFSNFCVFQPGKAGLLLDLVSWLNHANPPLNPRLWLLLLGLPLLLAGVWYSRQRASAGLLLLAAGSCGWALAAMGVNAVHAWTMPLPQCTHPETRVVIDRTTSSAPLSKGAYISGNGEGYGLLEQWIARLGCYTIRQTGAAAFSGEMLVVVCPNRAVQPQFREQLIRYVTDGGRLVVLDSPENTSSTANSLLWPFGLSMHHGQAWQGDLRLGDETTGVRLERACEVTGGKPCARLDKLPVAATISYGKGAVLAVGFASLWNDKNMGENWMAEPDKAMLARYEVLYALLRQFIPDKLRPKTPPAQTPPPADKPAPSSALPGADAAPVNF